MASHPTHYPWQRAYPLDIPWNTHIRPHPLFVLLDEAEDRYPDHLAVDFLGRKYTYQEIARMVRRMAVGLRKMGVNKGVKVGLFLPNCPQFVISYYAILKAGGTVVNYNPLYSERELRHQIEDSGTEIMVTLALNTLYPKIKAFIGTTKLKKVIVSELAEALPLAKKLAFPLLKRGEISDIPEDDKHIRFMDLQAHEDVPVPITIHPEDDVAVLQYTGGTTGVPKGTVLTHANLYANAVQCGMWFGRMEDGSEKMLGALPLFHVFAMTVVMNLSIHKGAEMILHPRFDIKMVLEDIHHKHPTLMPGVPTMFAAINNYRGLDKYKLTSLKMCFSGGGPLPLEVKEVFESKTGCKLVEGYGLSESSPVTTANPLFGTNKAGSIGLPLPATIMEVVDPDTGKLLGVRENGEICIRGPQIMRGYWQQLDETNKVLKEGRLHTGDIGYMDEEGYFFIIDRLKEVIIAGGYNIYPRNVEEAIYMHPAVAEAAVIGISHETRGQVPKAFVMLKEGEQVTEVELRSFLKEKLAPFEVPTKIEFREALPKSIIGKILKKELIAEEKAKRA